MWGALGILALLAIGGGTAVILDRRQIANALRRAFEAQGLPGAWGEAVGIVESGLRMNARNLTGPDGARGGAWGPTQITERTARGYGYTGPMEALTTDLGLAADLSAEIAAAGRPQSIEDLGAWWNAGHAHASDRSLPASTRDVYIPRLVAALEGIA